MANPIDIIKQEIEEYCEEHINNYGQRFPKDKKIIHDALWGTISLQPYEVAIIDLPLIQRLRQIKQTSLVDYIFPSCRHSRLEHTLGVLYQTQRLIDALNLRTNNDNPYYSSEVSKDLRLAAILHDSGHSAFSHASEEIYRNCEDIIALQQSPEYHGGNPHEILSSMIVQSKVMIEFINKLKNEYGTHIVDYKLPRVAGWIRGKHEDDDDNNIYRTQVVNGPFDADKLDYIFRDGYFSGLPLGFDLERMWATCDVSLDKELLGKKRILTLHQNSATPLEQILFNKINLFSVVYHHPKVRASECMFKAVVEFIQESGDDSANLAGRKLRKATDFLWITDEVFFSEALKREKKDLIHTMIHDILYRRFFVRALTISSDTIDLDADTTGAFWNLSTLKLKEPSSTKKKRELAKAIWECAGKPHTSHHIWLDLPHDPPTGEADRVFVRFPAGDKKFSLRKLSDLFPLTYWVSLFVLHKWRGHVFCPADCQQKVYEAAVEVLQGQFPGLKFKKSAGEMSHVPKPLDP